MRNITLAILVISLYGCSQNPVSNLGGASAALAGTGLPGANSSQNVNPGALVKKLNESMQNMSMAQKFTFEAFGLKKESEQALSNSKAFEDGNSLNADVLEKTNEANKKIDAFVAKNKKLDTEGKKKLTQAMPYYTKSLAQSAGLGLAMSNAVSTISTNPMALATGPYKVTDLVTVFTSSPKLLTQMASTTKNLATYASSRGVDTAEVESGLKDLK